MKKEIRTSNLYIIIAGVFAISSFFIFITVPNTIINFLGEGELNRCFWDFIMHVNFSKDLSSVYDSSVHACFPPLIYIFYNLISLMLPTQSVFNAYQDYRFFCIIFVIMEFVLFHFMCSKLLKKEKDYAVLTMTMLIILSANFINGVIQSANIAFFVMILLLIAVCLRESNSKFKQETALILIAVAAAIKIYPAVFGLLYLIEKKPKQAIRLIVYGVVLFFAPFALTGGISGFYQFFDNITTIQSTWGELSHNGIYNNLVFLGASSNIALVCDVIFGCLCFVMLLIVKDRWKKMFLLSAIIVMLSLWSGPYTTCFFLIPFLTFVNDCPYVNSLPKVVYTVLFSLMFTSYCISSKLFSLMCFAGCITILAFIIAEEACRYKVKTVNGSID